ncbi:MAG: TonB family protein [Proteobacteria bacterium]|nr:TonB family protein [Pseudomonadota bacterium]MBU1596082.1 TonB family protein [Pseudomonadota bacterium]
MDSLECLHPASHALPEGGTVYSKPSCLCLPGLKGKTVRVRNIALWLSLATHVVVFGALTATRMTMALPATPTLVEVEFVEIPGPKGGGGCPAQALPSAKAQAAPCPKPRSVAVPNLLAKAAAPQPTTSTAAPATASVVSQPEAITGSGGQGAGKGSGGGSGGGQGKGVGTSAGSGTGQGGVAVDRMPVVARRIKPVYPMDARRRGISGQVLLRLFVDVEGGVREVNVERAEPSGIFEDAAVEAARKWRFEPAVFKGAPVGVWMTLPVRFALEDR